MSRVTPKKTALWGARQFKMMHYGVRATFFGGACHFFWRCVPLFFGVRATLKTTGIQYKPACQRFGRANHGPKTMHECRAQEPEGPHHWRVQFQKSCTMSESNFKNGCTIGEPNPKMAASRCFRRLRLRRDASGASRCFRPGPSRCFRRRGASGASKPTSGCASH